MPAAPIPPDERLPRRQTLRRAADYQSCYRHGGRRSGAFATLHFRGNECGSPRLGVTVGRKVGKAVARHRLKRWARECFRRSPRRGELPGLDLVVHFKPGAAAGRFDDFRAELDRQLAGILRSAPR